MGAVRSDRPPAVSRVTVTLQSPPKSVAMMLSFVPGGSNWYMNTLVVLL
jgi:hypothetical protein